ncbi:MAG TPA: BREX system ATP-binding domain-containing protein [Candidatus Nitrosotenuis sp.]|nr:BREX system ATP-binding domain-containing protein [Candidatus Nitrosotenuis sp.]
MNAFSTDDRVECRRAAEALRSGVPSWAAVRVLGSGQSRLEARFLELLGRVDEEASRGRQVAGMLVRAGFGEGKSHLLTCFEHLALENNFAVSRVVISKETPLGDPARLLASAVEDLRVPGKIGRGLDEVAVLLRPRTGQAGFRSLAEGLGDDRWLNARFAATLFLYENAAQDEELVDRVVRFWSGDKLTAAEIRRHVKDLGGPGYRLEPIKARDLALQTFTFLPLLMRAAGLRGWVLLLDEVELVGRYTRLGRGRAYAELARWLGALEDDPRPGLLGVAAITSDFERDVLRGERTRDLDDIVPYLQARGEAEVAAAARRGMDLITRAEALSAPDERLLQEAYSKLRSLHGAAYEWDPPDVRWPETLPTNSMRTYVRAWINAWDVRRLYPQERADEGGYLVDHLDTSYGEQADLESGDQDTEEA